MLTDETKPRLSGIAEDAIKSPECKKAEREELEKLTEEFLRRKGRVIELRPDPTRADSLLF